MKKVWLDSTTDMAELADDVVRRTSKGGVVLLPTETQYGLCCNAEITQSVEHLNRIKKRNIAKPGAVFVRDWAHASEVSRSFPDGIESFLSHFWPGALTIVVKSSRSHWPGIVSPAGSIGLRCSSHPLLAQIQALSPAYLTATSANRHGESPSADSRSLINWLAEDVELFIFDPEIREGAPASTVVDITTQALKCVRVGEISAETVLKIWEKEIRSARR